MANIFPRPDGNGSITVDYVLDGPDGPGYYYWDTDYPDEGSTGAFASENHARMHANGGSDALVIGMEEHEHDD